jgi:hypothetical protein
MSQTTYDEFDDGDGGDERPPQTNAEFAALRKQTQATKKAEALAAATQRENAFLRAGIDPESQGIASYFVKGYDGDLSKDAILAAATAAGIIQAPQPTADQIAQQQAQADALAASQRVGLAANAQMASSDDLTTRQAMDDAYKAGGIEALTAVLQGMGIPRVTL